MPLPRITITGNLVADPELRFSQSGKALCKFRVASSESRKQPDGSWEDGATCFLDVTVFDRLAEECANVLTKGTAAVITGRVQQRDYETNEGARRTAYEVLADQVARTVKPGKGGGGSADPWASAGDGSQPPQSPEDPPF